MQPWVYIVLVGAVAIVYALILPARARQGKTEKQGLKEIETALELYMADIERENNELVQLIGSLKQQSQSNQTALQEQLNELRGQFTELQKSSHQLEARMAAEEKGLLQLAVSYGNSSSTAAATVEGSVPRNDSHLEQAKEKSKPVSSIKLRYPRLFELHEQGKSIDSIAKTAGLQRGEVQLILQLAKQEESL